MIVITEIEEFVDNILIKLDKSVLMQSTLWLLLQSVE